MRIATKPLLRWAMIAVLPVVLYFGSSGPLLYTHSRIGLPPERFLEVVYGSVMESLQTYPIAADLLTAYVHWWVPVRDCGTGSGG